MMGKSHLVAGACALGHVYVAGTLIEQFRPPVLTAVKDLSWSYLGLSQPWDLSLIPAAALCTAAYFLGNLLPDIDNPKSMLGRFIHLPVPHRTWLHAVYPYLILAVLGYFYPVFAWMTFGAFVHLFWDSFSACGNCWFYKLFSDYRGYPGGAKVKKGHKLKLYYAGEWSEYLVLGILIAVTVGSVLWVHHL